MKDLWSNDIIPVPGNTTKLYDIMPGYRLIKQNGNILSVVTPGGGWVYNIGNFMQSDGKHIRAFFGSNGAVYVFLGLDTVGHEVGMLKFSPDGQLLWHHNIYINTHHPKYYRTYDITISQLSNGNFVWMGTTPRDAPPYQYGYPFNEIYTALIDTNGLLIHEYTHQPNANQTSISTVKSQPNFDKGLILGIKKNYAGYRQSYILPYCYDCPANLYCQVSNDANNNCLPDTTEYRLNERKITIQPIDRSFTTDS